MSGSFQVKTKTIKKQLQLYQSSNQKQFMSDQGQDRSSQVKGKYIKDQVESLSCQDKPGSSQVKSGSCPASKDQVKSSTYKVVKLEPSGEQVKSRGKLINSAEGHIKSRYEQHKVK